MSGAQVRGSMDMTNMRMGPQTGQLVDLGSGKYQTRADFDMGGPWRIVFNIRNGGHPPENGFFDLQIP